MKIGKITIDIPIILAPMAGVTDYPFRMLCKEQGAALVFSEFVSSDGIIRENIKTLKMIKFTDFERPIGIQIFGDNPDIMAKAAKMVVERFSPDIIDINYGCPVPKITKKGAGSAALKDLCLMDDITVAVVESVPNVPVTVKMRAGWDNSSIVIPKAAERLEIAGVKAIALHPRTTKQNYKGKADWSLIKELKNSSKLPIIGNGDIKTPDDIMRMFEKTECDAVMIGRGSLGNPWFFRQAKALYQGKPMPSPPSTLNRIYGCKRHLKHMVEWHGEKRATDLMKKHFGWYIKGFESASKIRQSLIMSKDTQAMLSILNSIT